MSVPSLLELVALARAGATEQAWRLFVEAGLDAIDDDPAVLVVRGRLLKDLAQAAQEPTRRQLYAQAAEAYGRAGAISGKTYPLINAATLALLGGDPVAAADRAAWVLRGLADDPEEAETPYWREATRAEALLLLGRLPAAREALAQALAVAPRAWEDHAPTYRQLKLILEIQGEETAWLEPLRPPRSLHFAGRMDLGEGWLALTETVAAWLEAERVGAGFGALAAGADIVVAEALIAREAELHVVLPCSPARFRVLSVEPAGGDWAARFDALLDQADSLRVACAAPDLADLAPGLAVRLAAAAAMGLAVLRAETLATEALQLVVADPGASPASASGWSRDLWATSGRRQHGVDAPDPSARSNPPTTDSAQVRLAAILLIDIAEEDDATFARDRLASLAAIRDLALTPPVWAGRQLWAVFAGPLEAAKAAAMIVSAAPRARVAGHYDLMRAAPDPFGGPGLLLGPAVDLPRRILSSVPAGGVQVSEVFATSLRAGDAAGFHTVYTHSLAGEAIDDEIVVHALRV